LIGALKLLWASPASLIGALLAPFFASRRVTSGVLLCEGASWPGRFGWRYRAITFGHVILCVDELDDDLLAHELVHVRQYERLGAFFMPAYLWASVAAWLRGGHHYLDNRYEIEARHAEAELRQRD
jgi:hypothetical protein